LSGFVADQAIDLWWTDKTRKPHQNPRKKYEKHSKDDRSSKVIILDNSEDSTPVPSSILVTVKMTMTLTGLMNGIT